MSTLHHWLDQLKPSVPDLAASGWRQLDRLVDDLAVAVASAPVTSDSVQHRTWLQELRVDLAARGHHLPPGPQGATWQVMAQFVAGFHDLDLRDVTGHGHGALLTDHGSSSTVARWRALLDAGALVGIAATERHGGSRIQEITTRAVLGPDRRWYLNGEKCWISRLEEAAAFAVFFRDPDGRVSGAVVEATEPGLHRELIAPLGLDGWTWGVLRFRDVAIDPRQDLLGRPGEGLSVFRRHFAQFRPLVTATALGAAAGVHAHVTRCLAARSRIGMLSRIRDNALITLGRTNAEITAALLAAVAAARLAAADHPQADLVSRVSKAAGVDTANRTAGDLAPLIGATGFQQDHPVARARRHLAGLLYADGIHDSLYRSGGLALVAQALSTQSRAVLQLAA